MYLGHNFTVASNFFLILDSNVLVINFYESVDKCTMADGLPYNNLCEKL